MPELSVGAGDLVERGGFDDLPEQAAKPRLGLVKTGQALVKPQLAGVRYAAIFDLDLGKAAPLVLPPALPAVMANMPAGNRPESELEPEIAAAASASVAEAATPGLLPPLSAPVLPPLAGQAEDRAELLVPASMPVNPAAAVAVVAEAVPVIVPAAMPAVEITPSLPQAEITQAAVPPAPVTPSAPVLTPAAAPEPIALAVISSPPATLARPAASALLLAKAVALALPRPATPALAATPAASKPAMPEITAQLITRVDGKTAGAVDFQQTAGGLRVRLGSIVDVLADRYDSAQLARIRSSAAGNQYLSLAELQAQGVPISYDPVYDEFNVGLTDTMPKAARKVHIDQISTPHRGLDAAGMMQVPRPR